MANGMAFSRMEGEEDIYIGGFMALMRREKLAEANISHVLSLERVPDEEPYTSALAARTHLFIDIDDDPDENLLVHLPRIVHFVQAALYPDAAPGTVPTNPTGAILIHCAVGKSRSVSAAIAYRLHRYVLAHSTPALRAHPGSGAEPVERALAIIRRTRAFADPNQGFIRQLQLWWQMGCPATAAELEGHPAYSRWVFQRQVDESVACGVAPTNVRFGDEVASVAVRETPAGTDAPPAPDLRCKKCRRVLATAQFVLDHRAPTAWFADAPAERGADEGRAPAPATAPVCPHHFVEPLSWMRPTLEQGELEGRLMCPGDRCGATVGRYSWRGFRCSCTQWVTPAFSLQRSKIDEIVPRGAGAASGTRMPPSVRGEGTKDSNL